MRRAALAALATALIITACSPDETGEPTTSVGNTTTTLTPTTSTTPVITSSTAVPTTAASTTTTSTTIAETTTTSNGIEGNWADEPLIVTGFGAMGWWDGTDWVIAEDEGALPVVGGEDYQVAKVGLKAITTAGPQTLVCEPLDNVGVEVDNVDLLGDWPGPYGVAISAPWDLQPHLFEELDDEVTYAAFASELLSSRGLDVASPRIEQLYRTDLEGDGVNEVLVVAGDVSPGLMMQPGDYSIAFLRKVVQGEVRTAILGSTVILDGDDPFGASYSIGAVADLSGDGRMEIVVDTAYFESLGVQVREYAGDDLGPITVLQVGCGA